MGGKTPRVARRQVGRDDLAGLGAEKLADLLAEQISALPYREQKQWVARHLPREHSGQSTTEVRPAEVLRGIEAFCQLSRQGASDRLDFGRLFKAYRGEFPFLVGGSDEDPFEHRQVDLAQERLGKLGLQIERLPGGHLTANERPEALAALIAKFERGLVKIPEPRSAISARRSAPW